MLELIFRSFDLKVNCLIHIGKYLTGDKDLQNPTYKAGNHAISLTQVFITNLIHLGFTKITDLLEKLEFITYGTFKVVKRVQNQPDILIVNP